MKETISSIINECGNDCTLIAVSKTKSVEIIKEVYDLGIRDFGENKVQELLSKMDKLPSDIRWHMIGHLQTNKVKDIVGKVYLIHSVDSIKLAKEIEKVACKKNVIVPILCEINIASEDSKFGFGEIELDGAIKEIKKMNNVDLLGLMCVAPYTVNPEDNRKYFKKMRELKEKYNLKILSEGMSNDYKVALDEGSNYIRVGTLIFGRRDYGNN